MKRLLLSTSRAVTCIDSWLLLQKLVLLWDCFLLFCSWRRKFREIAFLLTEQFLIYSRNLFTNNCHLAKLASCVVDKDLTGAVEVKTLKETLTHHHPKSHEFRRGRSCSEEKCVLVSIDKLRSSECRQFSQRIWQVHLAFFPQESNKIQRKFSSASPKRWVLIIPSLFFVIDAIFLIEIKRWKPVLRRPACLWLEKPFTVSLPLVWRYHQRTWNDTFQLLYQHVGSTNG